jgi:hypothetical protein
MLQFVYVDSVLGLILYLGAVILGCYGLFMGFMGLKKGEE